MKKLIMEKWVAALRSGDYRQGKGQLRKSGNFCCLGVLCNLHAQAHPKIAATQKSKTAYLGEWETLPDKVLKWAGMEEACGGFVDSDYDYQALTEMNDSGMKFAKIADIIEKNYRKL